MADVTTDRLVRQIDWEPTRVNALSSGTPSRIRVPAHFATDRECLQLGCGHSREDWILADVTYGWIRNTLELDRVAISPTTCARRSTGSPQVEVEGEIEVTWDECGNLVSPFG